MNEDPNNYYEVLEVGQNAEHNEIQSSYKRLKKSYAKDSNAMYSLMSESECDKILNSIEEAFAVLGNPEQRKKYDEVKGFGKTEERVVKKEDNISLIESIAQTSAKLNLTGQMNQDTQSQRTHLHSSSTQDDDFVYSGVPSKKQQATETKISALNKFSLNYTVNETMESEIRTATQYSGDFLKKIREYKNVTIERMAEMTKISKTYIKHIENSDFTRLPAQVYTRGFVFQYAKCLKLSSELVATSYLQHLRSLKEKEVESKD